MWRTYSNPDPHGDELAPIQETDELAYLGSKITIDGDSTSDVNNRISKATTDQYLAVSPTSGNQHQSAICTKIKMF
jgi:hypothetical protein